MRRCRTGALALAVGILLFGTALAETTATPQAMFVPKVAADETLVDSGQTPDFVENLLTVAEGELGYTEGPNNYSKYGVWSGDPHAAWCAEFVCWCVDQTDQRYGTQLLNAIYPKYSGQNTGRDWFIAHGRFVYRKGNCPNWGYQWLRGSDHLMKKNEYVPHPGDLVFLPTARRGIPSMSPLWNTVRRMRTEK
ncbi:MAG TPA: hypothetical protein PLR69_02505 [Candidatus Limiplasma sp.]|nr:hypothetical protein [Candidatus Limiplasma sp.]